MKRTTLLIFLLALGVFVVACDGPSLKPNITPAQQERWEQVERALERSSVASQIGELEAYIEGENTHPTYLNEARGQLLALREEMKKIDARHQALEKVDDAIVAAVTDDRMRSYRDSDLTEMADLFLVHIVSYYRNLTSNPFEDGSRTVASSTGPMIRFDAPIRLDLRSARVAVRDALNRFARADLEDDCQERCLNSSLNMAFGRHLGGAIFQGLGRIDPKLLEGTAEALWREPDDTIFGVKAQTYYDVVRQLPRELYLVRQAMKEFDDDEIRATYRQLREDAVGPYSRQIWKFYFFTPRQNGLMAALEKEVDPTKVHVHYGFWHRRVYDESEPVVMKWLTKTLQTYDPEFWAEVSADGKPQR